MKRALIVVLILMLFPVFISAQTFIFSISGNRLATADSTYKTRYGKAAYFPEGKLAVRIGGNIYLWGSCGFLTSNYRWQGWSNKGEIVPDIQGESVLDKLIISGGLGFYAGFFRPGDFAVKFEAGVCRITDTIDTTITKIVGGEQVSFAGEKQAGTGFRGNIGVTYGLYKHLFAEVSVGYLHATDTKDNTKIKLGGFRLAVGLGIAF
jgi:hypothetical protein